METSNAVNEIAQAKISQNKKINNRKKISFISAILLIISSCIGSGIFFKSQTVLQYNSGSFYLAIFSWVLAAIVVLCMAIALIEVVSKSNDNLSIIGWSRRFCNPFVFKCCKNFMFYVYAPLEFFYLPYYAINSLQNMLKGFGVNFHFGTANDWAIWMLIAILIGTWLIFTSGINTKIGDIQNKIILSLKFIPLFAIVIIGFAIISQNGVNIQPGPTIVNIENATTFYQIWPGIGSILALTAIFFSFDGFYFAAGIQKEMKEPKKTSKAIIIGITIVSIVYLTIAIIMSLASENGSFFGEQGYQQFLVEHNLSWLFGILNLLIAFSVIGSLNGFTMWVTRLAENLILENELPFSEKLKSKINPNKPIVGAVYVYILAISILILFSTIGGLAYVPANYIDANTGLSIIDGNGFYSTAKLLTFTDLVSNWASIFAFFFIVLTIGGCYLNRKTKKVEVVEHKWFKPTAIVSMVLVGIPLIFTTLQPFIELFLINSKTTSEQILSKIMLVVSLFIILGIIIIPTLFDRSTNKLKTK